MVGHKNYHLSINEDFHIFNFQVTYIVYWRSHFGNEIPINSLFTMWNWTYVLDIGPWSWGAPIMAFVDYTAFKNARTIFFEVGQGGQRFAVGFYNIYGVARELQVVGSGPNPVKGPLP